MKLKDDWPVLLIIIGIILILLGLALGSEKAQASQAGQYCKAANAGAVVTSNSGNTIKCTLNGSRYRWTKAATPAASSTVKTAPKKANPNRALNLKIKKLTKQLKAKNKVIAARNKKIQSLNKRINSLISEIGELNAFVESLKTTYGVS